MPQLGLRFAQVYPHQRGKREVCVGVQHHTPDDLDVMPVSNTLALGVLGVNDPPGLGNPDVGLPVGPSS